MFPPFFSFSFSVNECAPLVYSLPCYKDRKCCLYLNEQNCGKWLVLHEHCFVVSHSLEWPDADCATDLWWGLWILFILVLIVVIDVSLIRRIRPLTIFSISSVKCVSLLFGKLAKHYRFHSQTEHIYCKESERQRTMNHLSPQCLYLLLIPFFFLFSFFKMLSCDWLQSLPPHPERVEVVDFKIMDL